MADFLPAADRDEMLRDFMGLVTAKVQHDNAAVSRELGAMIHRQFAASGGDINIFGKRMAKQVEAGSVVAWTLLKSLAKRLDLTEEQAWQIVAEANALRDPLTD